MPGIVLRSCWATKNVDLDRVCTCLRNIFIVEVHTWTDPLVFFSYNGFGGKVEPNETPAQAAARELQVILFSGVAIVWETDHGRVSLFL